MTSLQLIDNHFTHLTIDDNVEYALELMQDYSATHMPVVEAGSFKGLLNKKDIQDNPDGNTPISHFLNDLVPAAVNGSAHFLRAITVSTTYRTNVVAVVSSDEEYLGCITYLDLLNAAGNFCGAGEYGALIVLQIEKQQMKLPELNSIIESEGATILHFNASPIAASQVYEVSIGIDKRDISTILATLTQYKYKVLFTAGEDLMESELSDNYQNLMNYLGI